MIIATAGHVDHGKTTLVQALTGVDTDRLAEEKRRGMTIDLGFAYADLDPGLDLDPDTRSTGPAAAPLGFVDVPGHERFVRNMLAGVAAIDLALLVVAADDGPMPQTREHLAILALLGVPRLVVALTKADRVGPDRLADAGREVTALLADGPYAQAPVFTLATPSGGGVAALRQQLADSARQLAARGVTGHFRMAVDRSFTLAGAGRIVTGAVLSGRVQVGDAVIVSPHGTAARVRSLHAQNQRAESAQAGQRCALNLSGPDLKRAEPVRGDWVVAAAAHAPTTRLDVRLQVLAGEARPLSERRLLQLHLGAATVNATVSALDAVALAPGPEAWARLVLDRPVAGVHGDRFILRDAAAHRTVGGGWVVDPFGPARGRSRPARLTQLAALALTDPALALAALLEQSPDGVDLIPFARGRNLRVDELAQLQHRLAVQPIPGESGPLGLSPSHAQAWRDRVLNALDRCHAQQPDSLGPDGPALHAQLGKLGGVGEVCSTGGAASAGGVGGAPREGGVTRVGGMASAPARAVLRATLAGLVDSGQVVREGLRHRRHGHQARLADADRALLDRVVAQLQPAGLRPPIVGELAAALGLPLPTLVNDLGRLAHQGLLVRVAPNRYYLPQTVAELAGHARALAGENADGQYDAASFRDRTGIGRNLTVQVLEFLDRAGLSRFDGTRHRPVA